MLGKPWGWAGEANSACIHGNYRDWLIRWKNWVPIKQWDSENNLTTGFNNIQKAVYSKRVKSPLTIASLKRNRTSCGFLFACVSRRMHFQEAFWFGKRLHKQNRNCHLLYIICWVFRVPDRDKLDWGTWRKHCNLAFCPKKQSRGVSNNLKLWAPVCIQSHWSRLFSMDLFTKHGPKSFGIAAQVVLDSSRYMREAIKFLDRPVVNAQSAGW